MATTRFADHILSGTLAARPSASAVPAGTIYAADDGNVYQSSGSSWGVWLAAPAASIPPTLVDAKGDVLVGSADNTVGRLPVGSNGQVLTADSPSALGVKWAAPATPPAETLPVTIIDAKGDLIAGSGADAASRLAAGSNGQVLTADSAQALGVKWAAPAAGGAVATDPLWDTKGDLAVASGADAAAKLPVGSNGQVLTADSAQTLGIKWAAAAGGGTYRVGAGVPSGGLGSLGDLYEDTATGDLYQKQAVTTGPAMRGTGTPLDEPSFNVSHNVPMPAGVVAGDLLVILCTMTGSGGVAATTTAPAGWTKRAEDSLSGSRTWVVLTKVADGLEGSSVTLTTDRTALMGAVSIAYIAAAVNAFANGGSQGTSLTPTVPSVTSTVANCTILGLVITAFVASATTTPPAGWTERLDLNTGANTGSYFYAMDKVLAAAGASGTATPTLGAGGTSSFTYALALNPTGGAVDTWVKVFTGETGIANAKGDLLAASADNALARLAVGSNGQVLTADSAQTLGVKWATPSAGGGGALTLLSTITLASPGSFDVSSISGSYNDLICVLIARTTLGTLDSCYGRVNNDSGSNYYMQRIRTVGTSNAAAESVAATLWALASLPGASAAPNAFGVHTWTFCGYASTTWTKTAIVEAVVQQNGTGGLLIERFSAVWNSTAAINRIAFFGDNTFVTGSQLRIYGRL